MYAIFSILFVFASSPPDIARDPLGWFLYWLQQILDNVMRAISEGAGDIGEALTGGGVSFVQDIVNSMTSGWTYANEWLGTVAPWAAPIAPIVIGGLIIIVAFLMIKLIMMLL